MPLWGFLPAPGMKGFPFQNMSADNWAVCPACLAKSEAKVKERKKLAADSYGKVPAEQYLKNVKDAETDPAVEATMREDWEASMGSNGNVGVFYSCSCDCGFGYRFKHEKKVPIGSKWADYEKKVPR